MDPGRVRGRVLFAAVAALCACGRWMPEPVDGPVTMVVAAYDQSRGAYKLVKGEVKTLKFLRTLKGDAAEMLGGADIKVDYDELARAKPQTAADLEKLVYLSPGGPVEFAWFESGGMIHPEDFHSLNLATTYYNFERALLFFTDLGAPLYNVRVQYFPRMVEGTASAMVEMKDNAFWDPVIRTFVLLPFDSLRQLPLGMNAGVVAHEYAHAVFQARAFPGDGVPWPYARYFQDPLRYSRSLNHLRSVTEGLADFFGAAVTGDPAFLRKSAPDAEEARRVDPPQPRCLQRADADAANDLPHSKYDPYPMGSVLSAALWSAVARAPDRLPQFSRGLVDAMQKMGPALQAADDGIDLPTCLNVLASTFIADLKPRACGLLLDRFRLQASDLPECTEVTAPEDSCAP